ncbi:MAG: malonyl-ACP O-methyltransferase BioC [Burkholderiales bacterium]
MDEAFLLDRHQVRRAFGRAARTYDAAAVLAREVGARMLARLDYIKFVPDFILDAGSGTGHGSHQLKTRYPRAKLVALDHALAMLERARANNPRRWLPFLPPPVQHVCAAIERMPLVSSRIGMVWCNLALQWINQPQQAFAEMQRVLQPGGLLMFSTVGPDTLRELRQAFAATDAYLHVHRFMDMHDLGDMLVQAGFTAPVMDMERITLTYAKVVSLMRDLKAMGAQNALQDRRRALMSKSQLQAVERNYEPFRSEGRLPATFEVVYGHAWKPEARVTPEGKAVIEIKSAKR